MYGVGVWSYEVWSLIRLLILPIWVEIFNCYNLHPRTMRSMHDIIVQPLPQDIALAKIYADFMGYLLEKTGEFFREREVGGREVWERVCGKAGIVVVLAHPNGWGVPEQEVLKKAVLEGARAIGALEGVHLGQGMQVEFVSEAEASVHFRDDACGCGEETCGQSSIPISSRLFLMLKYCKAWR